MLGKQYLSAKTKKQFFRHQNFTTDGFGVNYLFLNFTQRYFYNNLFVNHTMLNTQRAINVRAMHIDLTSYGVETQYVMTCRSFFHNP